MKAVNLIPGDLRGGASAPGRTGNAVPLFLGALGVALIMVLTLTVVGRQLSDKETRLNKTRAEAAEAQQRAGVLEPYAKFAQIREKRVSTVTSLSRSRFNWPHALREVSRVMPDNVWLTQMLGTVAPGVSVEGGSGGTTGTLRGAVRSPAIEISGCTTNQSNVARFIAQLRRIEGVTRVSLSASEKLEGAVAKGPGTPAAASASASSSDSDCRHGNDRWPKFDAVVFFEGSTATPSAPTAGGTPAGAVVQSVKGTDATTKDSSSSSSTGASK